MKEWQKATIRKICLPYQPAGDIQWLAPGFLVLCVPVHLHVLSSAAYQPAAVHQSLIDPARAHSSLAAAPFECPAVFSVRKSEITTNDLGVAQD